MGKITNYGSIEEYLLSKKGSYRDFPFGPETAVYKVCNKMFALMMPDHDRPGLNLKCDPDDALLLRSLFDSVKPGYHMNKRHWNTIYFDGKVPEALLFQMIDDSYDLVVKGLTRAERKILMEY